MFRAREDIIRFFEKGIFPFKGNVFKTKEEKSEEKSEELKDYINNTFTFIEAKSEGISNDLLTKYFDFSAPVELAKKLFETKDEKKNSVLVEKIKNRGSNLKDETEKCLKKK